MSGKGDRQRPVDKEVYDKNYEEIKWDKDRCWGNVEGSSELMKLQFFSWGPVFKPISFFIEK